MPHPASTVTGTRKTAIWMEDPRATAIDRSILFFTATNTACVHARVCACVCVVGGLGLGAPRAWRQRQSSKGAPAPEPAPRSAHSTRPTRTVMCSAALPAMGSTMSPRNAWLMPLLELTASIAPVRNSAGQGEGGVWVGCREMAAEGGW